MKAITVREPKFKVGDKVGIRGGQRGHLEVHEVIPPGGYRYRLLCLAHTEKHQDGEIVEFEEGLAPMVYEEDKLLPTCPQCGQPIYD